MPPDLPPRTQAGLHTPLPGRSRKYFGIPYAFELLLTLGQIPVAERCRLYHAAGEEGGGHLLVLRHWLFTTTAHRFHFADIQALVLRRTNTGTVITRLLLLLLVVLVASTFLGTTYLILNPFENILIVVLFACGSLGLIANVLLGPTCVAEIQTAVHRETLPCLARWHGAQKVFDILSREVQAAQYESIQSAPTPESGTEQPQRIETAQFIQPAATGAASKSLRYERGVWHEAAFCLFLVLAISSVFDFFLNNYIKNCGDTLVMAAALVCLGIAVARQQPDAQSRIADLPRDLKRITTGALAVVIGLFITVQFMGLLEAIANPEALEHGMFLSKESATRRFSVWLNVLSFAIFGILGLLALRRFRRTQPLPPTPDASPEEPAT